MVLIAALSIVFIAQVVGGITIGNGQALNSLLLGLDLMFIFLLANFMALVIEVTPDTLRVSYGILRKTVRIEDVVDATTTRAGFRTYGGTGIRIGGDDSLAFTTTMGSAVKVIQRKGRPFVFSSKRPDYLSRLITAHVTNRRQPLS